jgi:pimeloyl-ACP methyl ester carboxylesterase
MFAQNHSVTRPKSYWSVTRVSARIAIIIYPKPDCLGGSDNDQPDVKFNVQYYVKFLKQFLETLNIDKTSLAGISMGGAISIGFTLENPEKVEKLVLVDSCGLQR